MKRCLRPTLYALLTLCLTVGAFELGALIEPPSGEALDAKAFQHPDLVFEVDAKSPARLPAQASAKAEQALARLGVTPQGARVDARGGRFETLLPSRALIATSKAPGQSLEARGAAAETAFRGFLNAHRQDLGIDPAHLGTGRSTVYDGGRVVHLYLPRVVDGVPVRGSYVSGVVNSGKLSLFGTQRWGDLQVPTTPSLAVGDAHRAAAKYLVPWSIDGYWGKSGLLLVPTAGAEQSRTLNGGYGHRLVWKLHPSFEGDDGTWELLVDAHTGEIVSFQDLNHYAEVKGGVLPVTNDGIVPDGVEQPGWPMPYDNVSTSSGTVTTDTGGNLAATGSMTSNLSGQYVRMNDNCGSISLTQTDGIDFGTSGGTDCTTPGFGGPGNTHASRTGFYELNKIIEMARSHLPGNSWLQQQLTANMNINNTCNAFWNGVTVNFYRSGGGCFNTGEIAGVFDHEWGHGIDDNDAVPTIAGPSGEGIADIYTALRLNDSCIGRNFRSTVCSGFGDPCTVCTGVRDIDYLKRQSGQPHDYSWSNANCGGSVHCVGSVYAEAVWSLWKRELTSAPYNMDNNTAHEVVNRLTFIGAGNTGTWFSGGPPYGGCSSSSGYMNYLAADDDNGDLSDGTPHMTAIFNAFNDQEIACDTPTVQDSGCSGTPVAAPAVTATAADKSVGLTWTAVSGASSYEVFRTEGVFACDFGKVRLGETTGLSWNDTGLQNGRDYSYVVIPKGPADSCFGPASSCTTVSPAAGPNLAVDAGSASLSILTGDGDGFIDNCEDATLTFDVDNTGLGGLTNVRIVSVTSTSHPSTTVNTSFPAAVSPSSIPDGGSGTGSFSFTGGGLSFGDTLTFQVEVTADELSSSRVQDLSIASAESDFQNFASRTFTFESDTEGWTVQQGTFNRTSSGGGAQGTSWYEASSANLDNQCDHIRSPIVYLNSGSTMSVYTQYDIEPIYQGTTWYDRANIGLYDVASGSRTPVNPDGGRLYNASGAQGSCGTGGQQGWADAALSWGESTWSASALGSAGAAGQPVQLDVRYGTDVSINGFGFRFDEVTLTDVDLLVPDTQSDTCGGGCTTDPECSDGLYCNGAEVCNAGTCEPGTPVDCDDGVSCTTDSCNEGTDSCDNTPDDAICDNGLFCDGAETCDVLNDCQAGSDPCPGLFCDEAGDVCTSTECDNDGVCEDGEDCNGCGDCPSFPLPSATCGNGLCEAGDGENCLTCPSDCNGVQNGNPNNRFCCGNGGQNPVGCSDSRCTTGGFSCTTTPQPGGSTCCGDLFCEDPEDVFNCSLDCGAPPSCGDGTCDPGETECSCSADCGTPPSVETGLCSDGVDNDCDGFTDCDDFDCFGDPVCDTCSGSGASCSTDSDCCSNKCKGNGTCR